MFLCLFCLPTGRVHLKLTSDHHIQGSEARRGSSVVYSAPRAGPEAPVDSPTYGHSSPLTGPTTRLTPQHPQNDQCR